MLLRLLLPVTYFLSTRAKNWRAILGFLGLDFVPLAVTLWLFYKVNPLLLGISFICFTGLYEIAYLVNDTAPSSHESGGSRLNGPPPPLWAFVLLRILWAAAAAIWIAHKAGLPPALLFLVSSAVILVLSFLHTRAGLSSRFWPRIITFTALATYKYAPWTLPFVPFARGGMLLATTFLLLGLPRTVAYGMRKLPVAQAPGGENLQSALQMGAAVLFLPIVLLLRTSDLLCLWACYTVILALSYGAMRLRRAIGGRDKVYLNR